MTDSEIRILAADFVTQATSCGVLYDEVDFVGFAHAILAASQPAPSNTELLQHLRQYQHNDCSGLVFGYDKDGVDRLIYVMERRLRHAKEALKVANDTLAKFPR